MVNMMGLVMLWLWLMIFKIKELIVLLLVYLGLDVFVVYFGL